MATADLSSPSTLLSPIRLSWLGNTVVWLVCALILGTATWFWALRECGGDLDQVPGATRDDVFNDNIAWHLAEGGGFRLGFSAWDWLVPYRRAGDGVDREWVFQARVDGPTTSRAPLFPVLLSGSYRLWGRRWDVVRVIQIGALTTGLATLLVWAGRQFGSRWLPIVGAATLAADSGVLGAAGQIMSEGTATLGMAAVLVAFAIATQRTSMARWGLAGVLTGLASLTQNTLAGWLALALPGLFSVVIVRMILRRPVGPLIRHATVYCLALAAVSAPWWMRNCRRTGALEPFGCASRIGMVGGYCDGCLEQGGNLYLPAVLEVERQMRKEPGFLELELPRREHRQGLESGRRAMDWAASHVAELPWLATMKGLTHLGLRNQTQPWVVLANAALVGGAIIGCWLARKNLGGWILLATVLSVLTTMLTWSDDGRLAIPIRPFWHIAAAVTVVEFWGWVGRARWNDRKAK